MGVDGYLATVGERVRAARERRKMSRAQLAGVLHVHPNTIRNWESAQRSTVMGSIEQIAAALEVSVDWLATGDRERLPAETAQLTADLAGDLLAQIRILQARQDRSELRIDRLEAELAKSR